ncbi:MAG: SDR family oxidoreductase [Actinomycetota bacterium]|nr:SDR family oxidoreductase [Actinomycetota bacterium]
MKYLITGAFGGLGSATVDAALAARHAVVAQDVRINEQLLEKWRSAAGDRISTIVGDLGSKDILDAIGAIEDLDRVVAAHGIGGAGALAELTDEYVRRVMQVDYVSVVDLCQATSPALTSSGGSFVALSSQAGLRGEELNSAYCAAKFALVGWASSSGPAFASEGFRVRILCPGAIDAGMFRQVSSRQAEDGGVALSEIVDRRVATISVGRLGRPAEIAAAAVWLGDLRTPTPVTVAVNGGDTFF